MEVENKMPIMDAKNAPAYLSEEELEKLRTESEYQVASIQEQEDGSAIVTIDANGAGRTVLEYMASQRNITVEELLVEGFKNYVEELKENGLKIE